MRRIILLLFFLSSGFLWGRLRAPLGYEDIPGLAKAAPLVFRGKVVEVELTKNDPYFKDGIAIVVADRWYKGRSGNLDLAHLPIHFSYSSGGFRDGHNCSDLTLYTYWIFFAKLSLGGETLELIHDCEGALAVSSRLGSNLSGDFVANIESDFRAGLADPDPGARLVSIRVSPDSLRQRRVRHYATSSRMAASWSLAGHCLLISRQVILQSCR